MLTQVTRGTPLYIFNTMFSPSRSSSNTTVSTVVNDAIPAVPPWSCDEVPAARPFASQKEAVDTAKKYDISQDFAGHILYINLRGTMRVSL